jgi:flagellar hook-length control protein FliK
VALPGPSGWGALGLNSTITSLNSLPLASASGTDAGQVLNSATLLSNVLPNPLASAATLVPAKPTLQTPVAATEGLDLLAPTAPLPQDAMRIRLVPAWSVVTQQLTQMSGTAMTSTWGALTAATLGAPTRSVALDLSTSLASDSEDGNSLNATDGGWPGAAQDLNRPGAASTPLPGSLPTPGMAQTLRQEHYQQLADRLGQAMAERLQSQIARGEWKLQMRLNPANLGRIDVELDMHAKGLDAMFRSENPLTRELMVQSMPKLKDTLSQSGMAVASVWVNSDAGRQSDGNPTPQRDRTDVSDTPKSAPADNGAAPATKAQRSTDGFDVLA